MSQPRLRLETCLYENGEWLIDPQQAHHLVKVRRCYSGSLVEGLTSGEVVWLKLECRGEQVFASEVSRALEIPLPIEMHLVLALLKNTQFDDALRFAAETGVRHIHLLACERSVPKVEREKARGKMERWRKVLSEATKQAGAALPPELHEPVDFSEFDFSALPHDRFAALLTPGAVRFNSVKAGGSAAVAIGPEGDWAPHESEALLAAGFTPVSLGRRILRASTAVAVACGWLALAAEK